MKKRGNSVFLLVFFVILLASSANAATSSEINKTQAYEWLYEQMNSSSWNENVDEVALSVLALGSGDYNIVLGDSSKVDKYFKENSFDCVASEPYLGPYFKSYPRKEEVVEVVKELNELYEPFFINLKKMLKKNGKLAIVMPIFKASNRQKYKLEINSFFKKSGFKIARVDDIKFPIVYKDKKSIIEREIYVLE